MAVSILRDAESGVIELSNQKCNIRFLHPKRGVGIVQVHGQDSGPLYKALFNELEPELVSDAPVVLFIDARRVQGVAIDLAEWIRFMSSDHGLFSCVHVLVNCDVISLSVNIIKHLSRTGELIRIHTNVVDYYQILQQTVGNTKIAWFETS